VLDIATAAIVVAWLIISAMCVVTLGVVSLPIQSVLELVDGDGTGGEEPGNAGGRPPRRDPERDPRDRARSRAAEEIGWSRTTKVAVGVVGVVVAALVGTYVLAFGVCACSIPTAPQATYDFEYDRATGAVTVTHEGGDSYDEENSEGLAVHVDGERVRELDRPFSTGDSTTVPVDPGERVLVVWTGPEGDKTMSVASFEVPE
jgi:hypothetical protein